MRAISIFSGQWLAASVVLLSLMALPPGAKAENYQGAGQAEINDAGALLLLLDESREADQEAAEQADRLFAFAPAGHPARHQLEALARAVSDSGERVHLQLRDRPEGRTLQLQIPGKGHWDLIIPVAEQSGEESGQASSRFRLSEGSAKQIEGLGLASIKIREEALSPEQAANEYQDYSPVARAQRAAARKIRTLSPLGKSCRSGGYCARSCSLQVPAAANGTDCSVTCAKPDRHACCGPDECLCRSSRWSLAHLSPD